MLAMFRDLINHTDMREHQGKFLLHYNVSNFIKKKFDRPLFIPMLTVVYGVNK